MRSSLTLAILAVALVGCGQPKEEDKPITDIWFNGKSLGTTDQFKLWDAIKTSGALYAGCMPSGTVLFCGSVVKP